MEVETPIAAAEDAIQKNTPADLMKLLNDAISKGVNEKFNAAISKKNYDVNNVDAGREYVESYVMFMHYVEAVYNAASHTGDEHQEHESAQEQNLPSLTPAIQNADAPGNLTHVMIISGTLLIIIIQVFLSRKKFN